MGNGWPAPQPKGEGGQFTARIPGREGLEMGELCALKWSQECGGLLEPFGERSWGNVCGSVEAVRKWRLLGQC